MIRSRSGLLVAVFVGLTGFCGVFASAEQVGQPARTARTVQVPADAEAVAEDRDALKAALGDALIDYFLISNSARVTITRLEELHQNLPKDLPEKKRKEEEQKTSMAIAAARGPVAYMGQKTVTALLPLVRGDLGLEGKDVLVAVEPVPGGLTLFVNDDEAQFKQKTFKKVISLVGQLKPSERGGVAVQYAIRVLDHAEFVKEIEAQKKAAEAGPKEEPKK